MRHNAGHSTVSFLFVKMISYMINQIFHQKVGLIPCSHACFPVIHIPQMCTNGTVGFSSAFEEVYF